MGISGFMWATNLIELQNLVIGPKEQFLDEELLAKFIVFCLSLIFGSTTAVLFLFVYHVFK
jgi:hypothetical protein